MRLTHRSYPHPVVGNGDDVPEYEFQATITCELGTAELALDVTVQCSSPSLNRLIRQGAACHAVHVECGRTLFRQSYPFTTPSHRVTIPAVDLNGVVELTPLAVATRTLRRYEVAGANPAYAGTRFSVETGDVLAVGDPQEFVFEHGRDPLRQIGSILQIVKSEREGDHPMQAVFETDKILIRLCESDFVAYDQLTHQPHLRSLIATSLVLPVLVDAIHRLNHGDFADAEPKWVGVIRRRMEDERLGTDADPLAAAQRLYGSPVHRAFQSAQSALESAT